MIISIYLQMRVNLNTKVSLQAHSPREQILELEAA
jgi:hypothetical protein